MGSATQVHIQDRIKETPQGYSALITSRTARTVGTGRWVRRKLHVVRHRYPVNGKRHYAESR